MPVKGNNQRSDREAWKLHAERKGGPLGGTSQQKTIKEFLDKLKKKKNPPEMPIGLESSPEGEGGSETANKGVKMGANPVGEDEKNRKFKTNRDKTG